MPVRIDGFDQLNDKLRAVFGGMKADHDLVGDAIADTVIQTTLASIGEGDQPFTPYSQSYAETLSAVGGKQRGGVDLRGVFYHDGQERKQYRSEKARQREGEGRQAFVGVAFAAKADFASAAGGRALVRFNASSGVTRPQLGLNDPRSEMSRDLVTVEATDTSLKIVYKPREKSYMIDHQEGNGRLPQRKWFTANKAAVKAAASKVLSTCIAARVQWFNDHGATGSPPEPTNGGPATG